MVFSTASILPSEINTWPGVSVGPETVWTVAPVSKMVSANEQKTPQNQKLNVSRKSTTAWLEIPRTVAVFAAARTCHALFPLSLGEREQQAARSGKIDNRLTAS